MRARSLAPIAIAGMFVLTLTMLSGCSNGSLLPEQRSKAHFDDYKSFSKDADLIFRSEDWIPADATNIKTEAYASKPGNMLGFDSTTSIESPDCVAGELTGKPPFETSWWPSTEPTVGMVCGAWQVFNNHGPWYAWTN